MSFVNGRHGVKASWLDGFGITISSVCVVHCLLLPIAIVLMPAWSRWLDLPDSFHPSLVVIALPFSSMVLMRSARHAGGQRSLVIGLAGLGLMACALLMGSPIAETALTLLGAVMVAGAHASNWRKRRHGNC